MKSSMLADKLGIELGLRIDPTRLTKYEARGITRCPRKLGVYKDYTDHDYERIKKTIILAELGVPLDEVRRYLMGIQGPELEESFKERVRRQERLVCVAKTLWNI